MIGNVNVLKLAPDAIRRLFVGNGYYFNTVFFVSKVGDYMSYISRYLRSKGQPCTIPRNKSLLIKGLVTDAPMSYVSIRKATKSIRDLAVRGSYVEGLILADSGLVPGEVFVLLGEKYLVQNVRYDPASDELHFFATIANATIQHKRLTEDMDEWGNIIKTWETLNADIPAFGEIITATMRQTDPGLLSSARYIFQMTISVGITENDRVVHNNSSYQVVSVDDLMAPGVVRIQAAVDLRE